MLQQKRSIRNALHGNIRLISVTITGIPARIKAINAAQKSPKSGRHIKSGTGGYL